MASTGRTKQHGPNGRRTFGPRPEKDPAFVALLARARRALGADLVLFGVKGAEAWQIMCHAQQGTANGATGVASQAHGPLFPIGASAYQGLLQTVVEARWPTELTRQSLATICPSLVSAGIARVVGSQVHGPAGAVSAVIVVAYRTNLSACHLILAGQAACAGTETVLRMGRLLATAHSRLGYLSSASQDLDIPARAQGAGDPRAAGLDDLLLSREVAAIFAVSPRTIANWATHGELVATRTAGGYLRFRRSDVMALYERRLVHVPRSSPPLRFNRAPLAAAG